MLISSGGGTSAVSTAPPPPPPPPPKPKTATTAPPQPATSKGLEAQQRSAIRSGVTAYKPAAPAVTASTTVVKAVKPFLDSAEAAQGRAQQKLAADQAKAQGTQTELNAVFADIDRSGPRTSILNYADQLQAEAEAQHKQVSDDSHALDAATAKVAAGKMVVYGEQAKVDQQTANASAQKAAKSYASVTRMLPAGASLKPGGQQLSQAQIDGLDDNQRNAYFDYLNDDAQASSDRAKVATDVAEVRQSSAQLQLFASDPKQYGTIAQDAVAGVNNALAPLRLALPAPPAIDAGTAKANLVAASNGKALIDAGWNYASAAVPAQSADNRVAAAQARVDTLNNELNPANACIAPNSPLQAQLKAAKGDLARAQDAAVLPQQTADTAAAYIGTLQAGNGPQASLANAQFAAAYAGLHAAQLQAGGADRGTLQAATEIAKQMSDTASNEALDVRTATDRASVTTDQRTIATLTAAEAHWNAANPDAARLAHGFGISVNTMNPYAERLAQAQTRLANDQGAVFNDQQASGALSSQLSYDRFMLDLPENLQNPQTQADRQKLTQQVNQYERSHEFQQGPIDGNQAISQVQHDLSTEKQYLASRPAIEQGWHAITGLFGGSGGDSKVEDYLSSELSKLQSLQKQHRSGELGDQQYQSQLHDILHDYGQTYLKLTSAEQSGDSGWRTADGIIRDGVAIGAGLVTTVATGGNIAAGAAVGFGVYQLYDGINNTVTVAEGGNVMADGHVSLLGLGEEAVGGHASMAMLERAGIDSAEDGVSSLAAVGGGVVAGKVAGAVISRVGGAAIAETVGGTVAADTTTAAADTVATQTVGDTAAQAARPLTARLGEAALTNVVSQGAMSAGQLGNAAIEAQAHGGLFTAEGRTEMLSAAKGAALNLAAAPLLGGLGALRTEAPVALEVRAPVPAGAIDEDFAGSLDQFPGRVAPNILNPKLAENVHAISNDDYAVTYSGVSRTPLVSSEHLTKESIEDAAHTGGRTNDFRADTRLPADERSELSDYKGYVNIDRGHMAPHGDMSTRAAGSQSFLLSNMVPQAADQNEGIWERIESGVRSATGAGTEDAGRDVYVASGPAFIGDNLESLNGRVLIPSDTWKAVYIPAEDKMGVYWVPNKNTVTMGDVDIISVNELQQRIGIDVFPSVTDPALRDQAEVPAMAPGRFSGRVDPNGADADQLTKHSQPRRRPS